MLASFNCRSENVVIKEVMIAELELGDIEVEVLFANVMEGTDDATCQVRVHRP